MVAAKSIICFTVIIVIYHAYILSKAQAVVLLTSDLNILGHFCLVIMMTHMFCISNLNRGHHILHNTSVLKPSELFCCLLPTQVTNLKKEASSLKLNHISEWLRTLSNFLLHKNINEIGHNCSMLIILLMQVPNNHKNTVCKCSVFANYSTMFYQYCLVLNQMQMHLYFFLQRAHHSAFWDCILHEGGQQKNLIKLLPTFSLHLSLCCCCYY